MKRRGFLKLFTIGVAGLALPIPRLLEVGERPEPGTRYSTALRTASLDNIEAVDANTKARYFSLLAVAGLDRFNHVFDMLGKEPEITMGAITWPMAFSIVAERACDIVSFEILNGDMRWLVRGDSADAFGFTPHLNVGHTLAVDGVGFSLESDDEGLRYTHAANNARLRVFK